MPIDARRKASTLSLKSYILIIEIPECIQVVKMFLCLDVEKKP